MGRISEKEFEREDPKHKGFSMCEYDLYARLNLSIRKNLKTGKFEIFEIGTENVKHSGTLAQIVKIANELEGSENTRIV